MIQSDTLTSVPPVEGEEVKLGVSFRRIIKVEDLARSGGAPETED